MCFRRIERRHPAAVRLPIRPNINQAQAPHSRFSDGAHASTSDALALIIIRFTLHFAYHSTRSVCRDASKRPGSARGSRLASLRYGICTAVASAIILQAAPRTVDPSMRPVTSAGLMSAGFLISLQPSKTPLQDWATPPGPWQHGAKPL